LPELQRVDQRQFELPRWQSREQAEQQLMRELLVGRVLRR
jgi:hypothetical protein